MIPRVSVIMITYKHEKFIGQAINSVLEQQTDFNFELIIADDNSPDKTHEVVNKIIRDHPRGSLIKYFKNEMNLGANRNYIKAYNTGSGKFIAVCEGDDYWNDPFKLKKQVQFLERNPEYILCYHDAVSIDVKGKVLGKFANGNPPKELSREALMKGNQPLPLTLCYRRLGFIPVEIENITNGDTFLISVLGTQGKGGYVEVEPACYRVHEGGVWSMTSKLKRLESKIISYQVIRDYHISNNNLEIAEYYSNKIKMAHKTILFCNLKNYHILKGLKYAFFYLKHRSYKL
ncbi:glycosyltransferase [Christiangramia crocea]|uniref:Glycosyltransferase n=1 Tax=Christiangramia crocea TaxID=2904124 RepID=A0A9X2A4F9_9FLAO|nr:glycosyltransferase [Gramella crocea]MCG9970425.1 glycosyltransferase [Gramella crocea]